MKDDTTLINEVLEEIPNKYRAVIVASKRAKAINDETARPLVRTGAKKPTTIALEEIAAGLINGPEARPELKAQALESPRTRGSEQRNSDSENPGAEKEEKELLTSPDESVADLGSPSARNSEEE